MTKFTKEQLITRAKMRLAMVAGFPESQLAQMDKCLAEIALERLTAPVEPAVPEGYALVPVEMTPSQMRAIQLRSEVGGYITSNLSGAYSLLAELWEVALAAAPKRME